MRAEEKINDLEEKAENLEKQIKEHSFAWDMAQRAERDEIKKIRKKILNRIRSI